jgi:hypothetical protein
MICQKPKENMKEMPTAQHLKAGNTILDVSGHKGNKNNLI